MSSGQAVKLALAGLAASTNAVLRGARQGHAQGDWCMGKKAAPDWSAFNDRKFGQRCWQLGRTGLVLDEAGARLCRGELVLPLETKPMFVLMALLRLPQQLVTKEKLTRSIWHDRPGSEAVLAKSIGKLRVVLGDKDQSIIQTVHGRGYRPNLVVEALDTTPAPAAVAVAITPQPAPAPNKKPRS